MDVLKLLYWAEFLLFLIISTGLCFEILKSPLEKAKKVLEENIKAHLSEDIDITIANYVSVIYARRQNNLSYGTIVKNLAFCLLENDWDRNEALEAIDLCKGAKPFSPVDFDTNGGPNFTFNDHVMKTGIPCKTFSFIAYGELHTTEAPIYDETYYVYSAIYKSNNKNDFTSKTQWPINPEIIKSLAKNIDFNEVYKTYLDKYWESNFQNFSSHLRLAFLKSVVLQYEALSLSEEGALLAMKAVTKVNEALDVKFIGLHKSVPLELLEGVGFLPFFNLMVLKWYYNFIHKIYSFDTFYIENKTDGHTILYVSGNSFPLHEFNNTNEMFLWYKIQSKNEKKRRALLVHFPFKEADDVRKLLENLWDDETKVVSKLVSQEKSIFNVVTENIMEESKNNFPDIIVSNRDKFKKKILNWIDFASVVILPFSLIFPQLLIFDALFIGMSLSELGIAIDDLRQGKSVGRSRLLFGILNAVPLLGAIPKTRSEIRKLYGEIDKFLTKDEKTIVLGENYEEKLKFQDEHEEPISENGSFQLKKDGSFELEDKTSENEEKMSSKTNFEIQLLFRGQKLIDVDGVEYLVDNVNKKELSAYSFDYKNGKIVNVKTTGTVFYNEKLGIWERMRLKGGAGDEFIPRKMAKYDSISMRGIKIRSEGYNIKNSNLEYIHKYDYNSNNIYFVENSKKETKMVYFDLDNNCWKYRVTQETSGCLALAINDEWEELSPELTVVIPDKSFQETFPNLPENWEGKINAVYDSDLEGPTTQVNAIIFKDGRYTVMIDNYIHSPILYNQEEGYWHFEGRSHRLEFTIDKRWVELKEASNLPPPKYNFITHEDYYRLMPAITLSKNTQQSPMILNFVITGEVPEKFFNFLKVYKTAVDNTLAPERIVVFTYGKEATVNFFIRAEDSITCLKIIDYSALDGLPNFVQSVDQYVNLNQANLFSLLIRLKLSQRYPGIFLTPDYALPISIFNEELTVDETGMLLQAPIYKENLKQYIIPGSAFVSQGKEGKISTLLDDFINKLSLAKNSGADIEEYESIFTESVKNAFINYKKYINYYEAAKDQLKFFDVNIKKINNYYEQLDRLLTKNNKNIWYTTLKQNINPFIILLDDPESVFWMQNYNVEVVKVNDKIYYMYPINSDVRELYLFKKVDGKIEDIIKTDKMAYLDETGFIEVHEVEASVLTLEDNEQFHLPQEVFVPMDGIEVLQAEGGETLCLAEVENLRKKVYYDVEYKYWAKFKAGPAGKKKLDYPLVYEEGLWKKWQRKGNVFNPFPPPATASNPEKIMLPSVPKIPGSRRRIPRVINFFVQDLSFESFLGRHENWNIVVIHYDIDQALIPSLARIMQSKSYFQWNNVRSDPSFYYFFKGNELGKYYEAARTNGYLDVAYNIMQYQIIKEKGGMFLPYWKAAVSPSRKEFTATYKDLLLKFPTQKNFENSAKYVLSNEIIISHKDNPFFLKLNEELESTLKKNDEFFGRMLKNKNSGIGLFPTSEVVGSMAFHRTAINHIPQLKALINYLNEKKTVYFYYRDYENARAYYFPIPSDTFL